MKKLLILIAALTVAPLAFPYAVPVDTTATQAVIQKLVAGASSSVQTVNAVGSGVVATSTGQVLVKASGLEIPVAVEAASTIGAAALAKSLAKAAVKSVPLVSTALAVAELASELSGKGYSIDPNSGALQVKQQADNPNDAPGTGYYINQNMNTAATTRDASCAKWSALAYPPASYSNWTITTTVSGYTCTITLTSGATTQGPFNYSIGLLSNYYVPPYVLATEVQTEADVEQVMQQNQTYKKLYDLLKQDQANYSGQWPDDYNPVKQTTPVTVTAPPVTTPETVTKTAVKANPDGSTDTTTTKQKVVVSPQQTGSTIGDSDLTYPTQTIVTSTTINNVTNQTTTTTTTTDNSQPDQRDPCANNPGRAGCSDLGTPPAAEAIPSQDVAASYTPVAFASNASCPQPISIDLGRFGGTKAISWQPFCDTMANIRPIFLACAAAACAWIFAAGVTRL